MFHAWQDLAFRGTIGSEFIGHDDPGHIAQALEQLAKEALGRFLVAAALHQHIEHIPVLVDRPPEVVQFASDADKHLIEKPLWPASRKVVLPDVWLLSRMEDERMSKKRHTAEEIVVKLRQVDVLTAQGRTVAEAIRSIGVTEVTYYRWRSEYGGLKSDQVKRLKELEAENARLRRAVSDLTLDKMILKEAAKGNF
jgi:putative transposase